ncbi:intraflagellar transport protein 74 homolog [Dysidea avara]|uniref:intraflagellar transport protein 74 homolog n=1 Tax=Dysidea avara TaxID=196820 RepID=UPI0033320320
MSYNPPGTSSRKPPAAARPSTRGSVPRMGTGFRVTGTAGRPGSRAGAPQGALNSQIRVADRPVTQQGLAGMRTASKAGLEQRTVQDRSYYIGLLLTKTQELNVEISKMTREIETFEQDNATYLTYDKKAESLAAEIKGLQGEMADINTLMDKLNTNSSLEDITSECNTLTRHNDHQARAIEILFSERQGLEKEIKKLEADIAQEKQAAEGLMSQMDPQVQKKYSDLKETSVQLEKELEQRLAELEAISAKVQSLEEEVTSSDIKQEAVALHKQLAEAVQIRDQWREKDKETPQEEKARLLKQVKKDNEEITSMERMTTELQDKMQAVQDDLQRVNTSIDEHEGERSTKYRELRKKEQAFKEYLDNFERNKATEMEKCEQLQSSIVSSLEQISQILVQHQHMPTPSQLKEMQEDLAFKEHEMEKAVDTAKILDIENSKLQMDFAKVEQLESKISNELTTLKQGIETMETEIETYKDLRTLKINEEAKKELLEKEKHYLVKRREALKKRMQDLVTLYEASKSKLTANDTFTQLSNLERRWQHLEQNNFVINDFIASKQTESNYQQIADDVVEMMGDYNTLLCQSLTGVPS